MTPFKPNLVLSSLVLAFTATALVAAPNTSELQRAFEALPLSTRAFVQQELATPSLGAGLYAGLIDGAYGPSTESALLAGMAHLEQSSRGQLDFDLETPQGVEAFVNFLASGQASTWLYGEGEECDGC